MLMAGLTNTVERNRHCAFALAGLMGGVLVLAVLLIQRLPVERTATKSAIAAPSSASQPGLFDTLLALHSSLPAAHDAVKEAFNRFKASLRPEPPAVSYATVLYVLEETTGNFVPAR